MFILEKSFSMKKIKIAEPCHENWTDFTPTQRGAFCGKCQINVIDFSKKSIEEIKGILVQNSGKHMCGRFSKTQLDDFNSDYHLWQNQSQNTFHSKFIFALVLVFGLTLFSCSNESDTAILGQITTLTAENTDISTETTSLDSIIIESEIKAIPNTETVTCDTDFEMGDMIIEEPIEMTKGELAIDYYEEEKMTKGKMAMEPEIVEITHLENSQQMMLGMVAYYEEPEIIPMELVDTVKNVTEENNIVVSLTDKFEANLYPNPTKNRATLDVNVLVKETYQINIFDSQGRLVKTIHNGLLETGQESFRLNLNSQENGIYYIQIVTETQNESLKIIKTN